MLLKIGLRIEWAKALARAERWEEEVLLLREEMRRVLFFLDNKAKWWREQGQLKSDSDPVIASGLISYAEKQASLQEQLATSFASMWLQGIQDAKLPPPKTWPLKFTNVAPSERLVKRRLERNKLRSRVLASCPKDSTVHPNSKSAEEAQQPTVDPED